MSYRYHIYGISNDVATDIRNFTTNTEYANYCANKLNCKIFDDYVPIYDYGKELYDFGSDLFCYESVYEPAEKFFKSQELQNRYQDYDVRICTKDMLKSIIESYRTHIIEMYTHLKENTTFWEYENEQISKMSEGEKKEYHYQMLLKHIGDHLWNWKFGTFNYDDEKITHSWLYEHAIFEILRIYKTFDWENNTMIIMGW